MGNKILKDNVLELLNTVSEIEHRYREIAKASGNVFNIFDVLRIRGDEGFHSRFLSMLLDPKGIHSKGKNFLESFLHITGNGDFFGLVDDTIIVKTEETVPDGRIDITINNVKTGKRILIENKIYAGDQPQQLQRYHAVYPDAHILYLTLDGKDADKDSAGDVKYQRISYTGDILLWLEDCQKWTAEGSSLWGAIRQYTRIVRELTGQSRGKEMEHDVLEAITKDAGSFSAYCDVHAVDVLELAKTVIEKQLVTEMAESLSMNCEPSDFAEISTEEEGWILYFTPKAESVPEKNPHGITPFLWFDTDFRGLWYGFSDVPESSELRKRFQTDLQGWEASGIIAKTLCNQYFRKPELLKQLYSGESLRMTIESKVKELSTLLENG
jgi:hypothetical protein